MEQLKTQQLELKKPQYATADDEYRKKFIELKVQSLISFLFVSFLLNRELILFSL
jgi:hypothetical protein